MSVEADFSLLESLLLAVGLAARKRKSGRCAARNLKPAAMRSG